MQNTAIKFCDRFEKLGRVMEFTFHASGVSGKIFESKNKIIVFIQISFVLGQ